eukprot:TRINITY_DN28847_c0_g3_i2.p1 TRINITY_DN28847_c0_g3~~TRINITY_DN28847_c0_g3_i2.p1  ORF type:complete len:583 (-),score=94.95 TRINITY_DN28847_c0_g3_i2:124-1830(-)
MGKRALALRICLAVFCLNVGHVSSSSGLRGNAPEPSASFDGDRQLLMGMASRYTRIDGTSRLQQMEEALQNMFATLPKTEDGTLSRTAVRYALHRLFVRRRSWYIRGLDPGGARLANAVDERRDEQVGASTFDLYSLPVLPTLLQTSAEGKQGLGGFTMNDTAAMAAALENLAHEEAMQRLQLTYDGLGHSMDSMLTAADADEALEMFVATYLLDDSDDWSYSTFAAERGTLIKSRRWIDVKSWIRDLRERYVPRTEHSDEHVLLSFDDVARAAEAIGDNLGDLKSGECRQIKHTLLRFEGRQPGRVRLSDFYNQSSMSDWFFGEKIDYLRALGVLDETNISNPLVIVANYLNSQPLCLRASGFYDICCRNECEDLMAQLEGQTRSPTVDPSRLAELVAGLSSDTVHPRDSLPASLQQRLRSIASEHDGEIPLQGRKFEMWMHHAFPRECPFPREEGSAKQLTPDEWILSVGESSHVYSSLDEMAEHIREDDVCQAEEDVQDELPWISYQEFLLSPPIADQGQYESAPRARSLMADPTFAFVVISIAIVLRFLESRRMAKLRGEHPWR